MVPPVLRLIAGTRSVFLLLIPFHIIAAPVITGLFTRLYEDEI